MYLWFGNCLRAVYELDDDDLRAAQQLIDEKLEERGTPRA